MDKLIQTNIVYTGSVNLSVKNKEKIIKSTYHNSGLSELFRLISKSISGNGLNLDECPQYIDLRYRVGIDPSWKTCLINKQSITQRDYFQENGFWVSKFATNIPYSEFTIPPQNSAFKNASFRLYIESKNTDLAFIDVDFDTINTIVPGSQAIVEWVMRLSNG